MRIHPTAIVDPRAELDPTVEVGPYSIIDANVVIGARTKIGPHVHLTGYTTIGDDCAIHTGAALGGPPQDRKFDGAVTYLDIGHRNIIREYVTMHLATGEGKRTIVGDDCLFMAYSHVGHNCVVGNGVCVANYVGMSGGCHVDDRVVLGGHAGLHQYVHVGRLSMVGGFSKVAHDVPPFTLVDGPEAKFYGLNSIGLRRAGLDQDVRNYLQRAFRLLCYSKRNLQDALLEAKAVLPPLPEVSEFVDFVERSGRNGRHLDPKFAKQLIPA